MATSLNMSKLRSFTSRSFVPCPPQNGSTLVRVLLITTTFTVISWAPVTG